MPESAQEKPELAFGVKSQYNGECSGCGGSGWVRDDLPVVHPEFGKLHPCPTCQGDYRLKFLKKLSRLNDELSACDLRNFDPRTHLHTVVPSIMAYVRADYGMLTLSGPHGTGKTFLMAAIANLYIETKRVAALYTTTSELLDDLRATFNPKSQLVFSSLFADVMDVPVLLLDEAEKFRGTDWAQEQMVRLMEHRHRNKSALKTVLATNTDLRPLLADPPRPVTLHPDTLYPGYFESRIREGQLITAFWNETDFRPIVAQVRRLAEEIEYNQGELL